MSKKWTLVYVRHEGKKEFGQIVQDVCPQDKKGEAPRLGGPDDLRDVVIFDVIEREDNGDPRHEQLRQKERQHHIRQGLSNVRRAKTLDDRMKDNTWWPRVEDEATPTPAKEG